MSKNRSLYLAELIGTYTLVVIGAGSVIVNLGTAGEIGSLGVAAAFGLVVMAMVYVLGPVSGAHINPAVTLAMYLAKKIDQSKALGYVAAQLIGAALAGYTLLYIFPQQVATTHLGTTTLAPSIVPFIGILVEALLTFFLVLVILAITSKEHHHAGLVIGATIAFDIIFSASITGGSMNPARTFGPALAAGFWTNHIVYWVGPLFGAAVGYLAWKQIFKNSH